MTTGTRTSTDPLLKVQKTTGGENLLHAAQTDAVTIKKIFIRERKTDWSF